MIIAALLALSAALFLGLGVYAFRIGNAGHANRVFLFLCASLGVWALQRALVSFSRSEATVHLLYRTLSAGIYFVPALFLHFCIALTGRWWLRTGWIYPPMYILGTLRTYEAARGFYTVTEFRRTGWGWEPIYDTSSPWYIAYNLHLIVFLLLGLALVLQWGLWTRNPKARMQARIILLTTAASGALGLITDMLLPFLGVRTFPALAPVFLLLWVLGMWRAVREYELFELEPVVAVGHAVRFLSEGLFILGSTGMISHVNRAAVSLSGLARSELVYRPFADLISGGRIEAGRRELDLRRGPGDTVPVSLSTSPVTRKGGRLLGWIVVARDLTETRELESARSTIQTLSGLLPMCSHCRRVRDSDGGWYAVEQYLARHSDSRISHGICPDCSRRLYPDLAD